MASPNAIKKFLGGTATLSLYSRDIMADIEDRDWAELKNLYVYFGDGGEYTLAVTNNWLDGIGLGSWISIVEVEGDPEPTLKESHGIIDFVIGNDQDEADAKSLHLLFLYARNTPSIPECVIDIIHMEDKAVIGLQVNIHNVEQLTKAFEFDLMYDFDYNRAHVFKAGDLKDQLDCSDMDYFHKDPLGKYVLWIINNFHPDTRVFFEAL